MTGDAKFHRFSSSRRIILLVFQYLCLKKRCLPCFMCEGKGLPDNVISSA